MTKAICVFCASSNRVNPDYLRAAETFGRLLAEAGADLVYGGGKVGLMGAAALGAHGAGGRVIGIIPKNLMTREVAYTDADELVVTEDLFKRKEEMIRRADAFAVLPGGFGTLDEMLEVITLRQLGLHRKPIAFLNIDGFFDRLFDYFAFLVEQAVAPSHYRDYYRVFDEPQAMVTALLGEN